MFVYDPIGYDPDPYLSNNPYPSSDLDYFDSDLWVDFYVDAQMFIRDHAIVVIPATITNSQDTEMLKQSFLNAKLPYDDFVYDYESIVEKQRKEGAAPWEITPLFRRGKHSLPMVILGGKNIVSSYAMQKVLKNQSKAGQLVIKGYDWMALELVQREYVKLKQKMPPLFAEDENGMPRSLFSLNNP